jgi:CheY-like chemotaxis protein
MNAADTECRVLVIDDNPAIHEDFQKVLCVERYASSELEAMENSMFGHPAESRNKQRRFRVDSAHQGHVGLAKLYHALQEGQPYAMAFVDVRMPPGWDGIEVIPRLWVADPGLPVVICTAHSDYSWEEIFDKLGHTDHLFILKKPFDRIELLQLAHTLAARIRSRSD